MCRAPSLEVFLFKCFVIFIFIILIHDRNSVCDSPWRPEFCLHSEAWPQLALAWVATGLPSYSVKLLHSEHFYCFYSMERSYFGQNMSQLVCVPIHTQPTSLEFVRRSFVRLNGWSVGTWIIDDSCTVLHLLSVRRYIEGKPQRGFPVNRYDCITRLFCGLMGRDPGSKRHACYAVCVRERLTVIRPHCVSFLLTVK